MIIVNYKDDTVGIFDTVQEALPSYRESGVDMAELEIKGGIVGILKAMKNRDFTVDQVILKLVGEGTELWRITK
jgi:hypothetical protein